MKIAFGHVRTPWAILSTALVVLVTPALPAQQVPDTTTRAGSHDLNTQAEDRSPEAELGADEVVRIAVAVIDRAEQEGGETTETLLEKVNEYIDLVESRDPDNTWLSYLYGRAYGLAGRQGDAIEQLRKFVSTRDGRNEWRAYRSLGDLFVGDFPRLAEANYEKALALNPEEPDVLRGLSICKTKFGSLDEAIRLARSAVAADGRRRVRFVSHLASLLTSANEWAEALREEEYALRLARAAVDEQPGEPSPLIIVDAQYQLLISILQARINGSQEAPVSDFLQLADYVRRRTQIVSRLALHKVLLIMEAHMDENDSDVPVPLLQQYGVLLAEVDRLDEAKAVFERLLARKPDNATATEWLARLRADAPSESAQP